MTGISYGGIQSLSLGPAARPHPADERRVPALASPGGKPMRIAAAYPRWGASDLTYALHPNGRFLDFRPYRVGRASSRSG